MSYYNPQQYISIPHFDSPMKSDNFRTFSAMQEAWNRYQQEKRLEELHPLQVENYGLRNRNLTLDNELQEKLNPLKVKSEELLNVLRDKQNTKTQQEIDFDAENNPLLLENNRLKNIGQGIDNQYGNLKNANQRIQNEQAQWGFNNLQNEYEAIKRALGGKSAAERQAELLEQEAQARIETENANRDWYNSEKDKNMMALRAGNSTSPRPNIQQTNDGKFIDPSTGDEYERKLNPNTLDFEYIWKKPTDLSKPVSPEKKYSDRTLSQQQLKNISSLSPEEFLALPEDVLKSYAQSMLSIMNTNSKFRDDVLHNRVDSAQNKYLRETLADEYNQDKAYTLYPDGAGSFLKIPVTYDKESEEGKFYEEYKKKHPIFTDMDKMLADTKYLEKEHFNSQLNNVGFYKAYDPISKTEMKKAIQGRDDFGKQQFGWSPEINKYERLAKELRNSSTSNEALIDVQQNFWHEAKEADPKVFENLKQTTLSDSNGNISRDFLAYVPLIMPAGKQGINLRSNPKMLQAVLKVAENPEEFNAMKALKQGEFQVFGNKDQDIAYLLEDLAQFVSKQHKGPKQSTGLTHANSYELSYADSEGKKRKPLGLTLPTPDKESMGTFIEDFAKYKRERNWERYVKREKKANAIENDARLAGSLTNRPSSSTWFNLLRN